MSLVRVFVYGTLKRGEPNHLWISDCINGFSRFVGMGRTVEKYPLVIATKYNIPFLLDAPGCGHNVIGEVYEVDKNMLTNLDVLEDHPNFYIREQQDICLTSATNDKSVVECWVYLLKSFKPEMLHQQCFENYSSLGPHGLIYKERYLREPHYNFRSDVQPDKL